MQLQRMDQRLVQVRVGKNREDVLEEDAGFGEVLELPQRLLQSYLEIGEFGGAGGGGGGEVSRGIVRGGGIWLRGGRMRRRRGFVAALRGGASIIWMAVGWVRGVERDGLAGHCEGGNKQLNRKWSLNLALGDVLFVR